MKLIAFALSFVVIVILLFNLFEKYSDVGLYELEVTEILESTGELISYEVTFEGTLGVGTVRSIEFTNNDMFLAVGISTASKLKVYKENIATRCYDLLTPQVETSGLGNVFGVDFSDNSDSLAVGHDSSPYIKVYDIVGDTFTHNTDVDLIVDNIVYDLKYYDDYLLIAGDFTNYLQLFQYESGDYIKLSGTIDELPTGRVWDIEYNNGYIFIATEASPYLIVYKQTGDNLVKLDNPVSLPTQKSYSIDVNDRGDIVIIGQEQSPFVKIYKFENEVLTVMTIDSPPTQTLVTWSVKFVDNTYLYIGGDLDLYKYKLNDLETGFDIQINDLLEFTPPIYVMDHTRDIYRGAIGDVSGYDCYIADLEMDYTSLYLDDIPDSIISIIQYNELKEYAIDGLELTVIDQHYNKDIVVRYNVLDQRETSPLIFIIPLLAVVAVILGIALYVRD